MADNIFEHPRLAAIYDALDPDRSDLDVYAAIAEELASRRVLDVGCGTGTFALLLASPGLDVIGVDPARASIDVARAKPGAERVHWIHGDATSLPPLKVDLATMTGNVAQAIVEQRDWEGTLGGIHDALRPDGRLVFETRDPASKAWREWSRAATYGVTEVDGVGEVESWIELTDVTLPLVRFRGTCVFPDGEVLTSESTLRFRESEEFAPRSLSRGTSWTRYAARWTGPDGSSSSSHGDRRDPGDAAGRQRRRFHSRVRQSCEHAHAATGAFRRSVLVVLEDHGGRDPQLSGEPLVSVVTPVYNGATYIQECIESVLRQTYTNWEYAVIDNASTDQTPEIVARFAESESRVRHLRFEEFVSMTENHNRAFRTLTPESEFCKVVQGDDWLYPECLERMVAVAQSAETVGIVSAYQLWERVVNLVGLPYSKTVFGGREILRQCLLGGPYVTGAPSALLYRARLVRERDPFYLDGFEHQDTEAAYWLLSQHDFGFVHQVLTFARRQEGAKMAWNSLMNTYVPENIRFVLRFGPVALAPVEYRRQLRLELRRYVAFHARQLPKPSRLADPEFFALHRTEVDAILEEGGDDVEVRAAMQAVKAMLLRGWR